MKIAVVTDSGSNYFNESLGSISGLYALELQIIDGDAAYLESVEINNEQVNNLMRNQHVLTTSLPPLGRIEALFKKIKSDGYDKILAFPITAGISGTLSAMRSAADFVDIRFESVDCFSTFHNALDLALFTRRKLDEGKPLLDIIHACETSIRHSDTFVIPDDLQHLVRGGRLTPLAATLAGFLKIKPVLHLNLATDGMIEPFAKVRTMTKAIQTVIDEMKEAGVDENYRITVAHVDAPQQLNTAIERLRSHFPDTEIRMHDLISTVSVHCGIGSIALQYMKKPQL